MTDESATAGRPAGFSREAAIDGAMNLFWRDGFLATSASDLAMAMDIQRSSFYNSFKNREAVFLESLERYSQISPDRVLETLTPGDPVLPLIAGFFRELCRQRVADEQARGCLVCNSIGELVGVDDQLGPVLEDAVQERVRMFERAFEQAVEQDELPASASARGRAQATVAFLLGINLLSKTVREEDALRETCRTFLRGIGVPATILERAAERE